MQSRDYVGLNRALCLGSRCCWLVDEGGVEVPPDGAFNAVRDDEQDEPKDGRGDEQEEKRSKEYEEPEDSQKENEQEEEEGPSPSKDMPMESPGKSAAAMDLLDETEGMSKSRKKPEPFRTRPRNQMLRSGVLQFDRLLEKHVPGGRLPAKKPPPALAKKKGAAATGTPIPESRVQGEEKSTQPATRAPIPESRVQGEEESTPPPRRSSRPPRPSAKVAMDLE